MTDCAARALSLFDAWERRDYDEVLRHFASGASVRDQPRATALSDPEDIGAWMKSWVEACSDATAGAAVTLAAADGAVVEGVYAGTNDGPLGPLPATGRAVSMPFTIVIRFDGAGLVTDYSVYYDQLTLLTQLGHIPEPN